MIGVVTVVSAVGGAGDPAGAEPGPGGAPARSGTARSVTLLTGDKVLLRRAADGTDAVEVRHGPGRDRIRFGITAYGGQGTMVVPSDARALLASGRLDPRLFNVTRLLACGYGDASRADLPVLVQGAAPRAAGGTVRTAEAPGLGFTGLKVAKNRAPDVWRSLTGGTAGMRTLGPGTAKIWLDGKVRALDDKSNGQIGAPAAWRAGYTGKSVGVAVLDSGYDPGHPDLKGVVTASKNFTYEADVRDHLGHGTHVAATVAGSGAASHGRYRGVAPGARLAIGKVLDGEGVGYDSGILAGMDWAARTVHAKVVNMSLGGTDERGLDPVEQAVNTLSRRTGTLFVVAAGNEGPAAATVDSPASADAALAVGAVDGRGRLAGFSSRGPRKGDSAVKPDITAPGVGIISAWAKGTPAADPVGTSYRRASGTSMATPHVAGAAAIVAQRHPGWTGEQIKAALMNTAKPTAAPFLRGAGLVDLAHAVSEPISTSQGSLNAYLRWPHTAGQSTVRTLTYRNDGTSPATLSLNVRAARRGGGAAPAGMFALSARRLAVPAHGQAQVRLTVRAGGARAGAYAGAVTATHGGAGTAVRTIVGAYVEPKATDLTVTMLDRRGKAPLDDGQQTIELTNMRSGEVDEVPLRRGKARVRLPSGPYFVGATGENAASDGSLVLSRPLDVRPGTQRLLLDGRKAVRTGLTVDAPGVTISDRGQFVQLAYRRGKVRAEMYFGGDPLYVLPFRAAGTTFLAESDWAKTGECYAVADVHTGGVPAKLVRKVARKTMAVVPSVYRAPDNGKAQQYATLLHGVQLPGSAGIVPYDPCATGTLPAKVSYYFSPLPAGASWWRMAYFNHADQRKQSVQLALPRNFTGRRHPVEVWGGAVAGPSIAMAGARRTGNEMNIPLPSMFSDGGGHLGDSDGPHTITLDADGRRIAQAADTYGLTAGVPARDARYTLTVDHRRALPMSTRVTSVWTFRSGPAGPAGRALPLQAVRFAPPGLDGRNQAKAGTTLNVPVRVEGTTTAKVKRLTVQASFDDGRTWTPLRPRPAGGGWQVAVTNPGHAGFVSLRATAQDPAGDTVTQTILRAYAVT
ncbi:S8 family serine peptidase [Actinomadura formosensis]|uniref:S8 family serine peptidase n=1 Tax=Actinomadura formosensis TaxID=60706 RepID=UPI000833AB87|nr:S8 family serine peptidase [Actinomadura formosensis]